MPPEPPGPHRRRAARLAGRGGGPPADLDHVRLARRRAHRRTPPPLPGVRVSSGKTRACYVSDGLVRAFPERARLRLRELEDRDRRQHVAQVAPVLGEHDVRRGFDELERLQVRPSPAANCRSSSTKPSSSAYRTSAPPRSFGPCPPTSKAPRSPSSASRTWTMSRSTSRHLARDQLETSPNSKPKKSYYYCTRNWNDCPGAQPAGTTMRWGPLPGTLTVSVEPGPAFAGTTTRMSEPEAMGRCAACWPP